MREKLIELIKEVAIQHLDAYANAGRVADYLIAHGVTIQRWIPVEERLPEEDGDYLVCIAYKDIYDKTCYIRMVLSYSTCLENVDAFDFEGVHRPGWYDYDSEVGYYEHPDVSHWVPLPPKEEE